jgi:hypothetical protein
MGFGGEDAKSVEPVNDCCKTEETTGQDWETCRHDAIIENVLGVEFGGVVRYLCV